MQRKLAKGGLDFTFIDMLNRFLVDHSMMNQIGNSANFQIVFFSKGLKI